MTRLLVIMGSGETTPTMIKPHRRILETVPADAAVLLDTPYGFQLNADEISARTVGYFAQSVGRQIDVVSWRTPPPPGLERERALTKLRSAQWIFAGPGSPTYALRQWRGTELPDLLPETDVLVFASAAALTLGSHTVPVYEIYKAGITPYWEPGLDLFRRLTGVPAVVIPHYDNAEGGHHDTRFCYLGEPRLSALERELLSDTLIIGVDEHTALFCDLESATVTVVGNGGLTLRRNGSSVRYESGSVLPLSLDPTPTGSASTDPAWPGTASPATGPASPATLGTAPSAADSAPPAQTQPTPHDTGHPESRFVADSVPVPTSLRAIADDLESRFATALSSHDIDGCVDATLELEQAITDWTADTLTSSDTSHARGLLRSMIVRLGSLPTDPTPLLARLVEPLLTLRTEARARKDFATSDLIRDTLLAAGLEIRDTPTGPQWSITS